MSEAPIANILPFYLLIDVSWSMTDDGKLEAANEITEKLKNALAVHPVIADKVRFGVIDFSDDARVVFPLGDLSMHDGDTTLEARGGTSYAAAFTTLREALDRDVRQLKADGFAVHRPAVFFISDGEPTDADGVWEQAFEALTSYDKSTKTGFAFWPNIIPFGVGASAKTMAKMIHPRDRMHCYLMKEGADPGDVLAKMAELLVSSTLASGASAGEGGPPLVLPQADDIGDDIDIIDYEEVFL